jgi:hypothetical protein
MIHFIPQDKNPVFKEKKIEFSVYYIHFSPFLTLHFEALPYIFVYWLNIEESNPARQKETLCSVILNFKLFTSSI